MNPFQQFCEQQGLPAPELEHQFHATRKWRFDYAWPDRRVALEVDGGVWTGGRHVSPAGYMKDLEKLNTAACLGWRVIRVTPRFLISLGTVAMLKEAMK